MTDAQSAQTALDKLIEAVEAGTWEAPWREIMAQDKRVTSHARGAYHGSLDDALTLHEALLDSGFHAEIWACTTRPRVKVVRFEETYDGQEQVSEARSWLLAILRAYRSIQS